jgi:hypothetical protein
MSLATRFQQTSSNYIIKVNCLVKDQPYPITRAERCHTRYGPAVLLTIRESKNSFKKVFLLRRYSEIMTDEVLTNINSGKEKLNLVYRDKCLQTNGHMLAITEEKLFWLAFIHYMLIMKQH